MKVLNSILFKARGVFYIFKIFMDLLSKSMHLWHQSSYFICIRHMLIVKKILWKN